MSYALAYGAAPDPEARCLYMGGSYIEGRGCDWTGVCAKQGKVWNGQYTSDPVCIPEVKPSTPSGPKPPGSKPSTGALGGGISGITIAFGVAAIAGIYYLVKG